MWKIIHSFIQGHKKNDIYNDKKMKYICNIYYLTHDQ